LKVVATKEEIKHDRKLESQVGWYTMTISWKVKLGAIGSAGALMMSSFLVAGTQAASAGSSAIKVKHETIGVLDITNTAHIELVTEQIIQAAAAKLGWKVIILQGQASPTVSATAMESLVAQHVKGIITMTVEASTITTGLHEAKSAGIPVCEATGQVHISPLYTAQYAENEYLMGYDLGAYIAKTVPNAQIADIATAMNLAGTQREAGLVAAIAKVSTAKIVGTNDPDLTNPFTSTEQGLGSIITANAGTNAVYTAFDMMAQGAVAEVKIANSTAKVYSYFTEPSNLVMLNSNTALQAVEAANTPMTALVCMDQMINKFQKNQPFKANALTTWGGVHYKLVARSTNGTPVGDAFPNSKLLAPFLKKWAKEYPAK
jgi:ABC-type sugar transport system substrate-binding protein